MSADTKAALEQALSAHIADENDGDIATAWVIVAECASLDSLDNDESAYYVEGANAQSRFTGDGLLYAALHRD